MNFDWQAGYPSIRVPVFARNIVSTSHPLAAQAGLAMIQRGGNAVDAAIAAAAAMTIVEPCSNGLGSDAFAIVWHGGKLHGLNEAELAAVAIDEAQHKGVGTELYRRLIEVARKEKIGKVVSNMLPENREMRALCAKLGFKTFSNLEDNMIRAELEL